ncbi:hypothetical protein ARMGADRAFT_820551 [Armillaria gallica]|uniref:Uncharacterized protein n=1 Tax=Armillaria gallica TaxID=47427 RepID=A0A2H3CCM8_ARMGA|nr:hypothetical protein ARMGADRAFT_820551 [Armillaria gallica]
MQVALNHMKVVAFESTGDVSEYGDYAIAAIEPIVEAIAEAAGFADTISVRRRAVPESTESDFSLLVQREVETEAGHAKWVPIQICSDNDIAYPVLLSKAEELSQSFGLDTNQKQRGAKAMVVKLVLQMIAANAEYGLFFAGFIAIAAQLGEPLIARSFSYLISRF